MVKLNVVTQVKPDGTDPVEQVYVNGVAVEPILAYVTQILDAASVDYKIEGFKRVTDRPFTFECDFEDIDEDELVGLPLI